VDRNGYLEGIFVSKTDVSNFISKAFVSMKVTHIRKVLLGTCFRSKEAQKRGKKLTIVAPGKTARSKPGFVAQNYKAVFWV